MTRILRWTERAAPVLVVLLLLGACTSQDSDDSGSQADEGVVTPVVVCADPAVGAAYFGYANSGSVPVSIPVGDRNRLAGEDGTELTREQPDVFAPGEQGAVVWVELVDDSNPVSWLIISPDGTERTATADGGAPACTDGYPAFDPPDDRDVSVGVAVEATTSASGGVEAATLVVSVEGLPSASRCPAGPYRWTPVEPDVRIDAFGSNVSRIDGDDQSVVRLTVDDPGLPVGEHVQVEGFTTLFVHVDAEDRCLDDDGTSSRAWAASESLIDLSQRGVRYCFGVTDGGYGEVDCSLGPVLAPTGGMRSR